MLDASDLLWARCHGQLEQQILAKNDWRATSLFSWKQ